MTDSKNDGLTAAAIGLLAMCIVTCDHEALGHGSACLLLDGHIRLLTSSLFRCDTRSGWIDPAGPAANLIMGTAALLAVRLVPQRMVALKLLLLTITAFSFFWEAAYVVDAMIVRHGDLYFFAEFLVGEPPLWLRVFASLAGVALYVATIRLTTRALLRLWPSSAGRSIARTVWLSATAGAAVAALLYRCPGWGNERDAVLEIGAASLPLLFIPRANTSELTSSIGLERNWSLIVLAVVVFVAFAATLGRGSPLWAFAG